MKKRWSAGEPAKGSVEDESGVREPNSKSAESGVGVLGKEKESPEEGFLWCVVLFMMEELGRVGFVIRKKIRVFICVCVMVMLEDWLWGFGRGTWGVNQGLCWV